jgi:hypothetical protein
MTKKNLIFIILILFPVLCGAIEKGSIFRFYKLLREFDNPIYSAKDRDIIGNIDYSALQYDSVIPIFPTISELGNFDKKYRMDFTGTIGYTGRKIKSSPTFQSDDSMTSVFTGEIDKETRLSGNQSLGTFDTSVNRNRVAKALIDFRKSLRFYSPFSLLPRHLFGEIQTSVTASGNYRVRDDRYHYQSRSVDNYKTIQKDAVGAISLSPIVGYGKRLPIAPVYKAFEIERKLKKVRALRSDFSDSTLLKLSALIGSIESFKVNYDRPDKYYMKEIEKIVSSDSSCDRALFDAFALFKAFETLGEPFPLLFHGFEIKLITAFSLSEEYYRTYFSSDFRNPISNSYSGMNFDWSKAQLQLEWTIPLSSRFFPQLCILPYDNFSSCRPFHALGSLGAYFLLTNSIIARASVSEIPFNYMIPKDKPGLFELEFNFYLEDHISLKLYCFKRPKKSVGTSSYYFNGFDILNNSTRSQEGISFKVMYDL